MKSIQLLQDDLSELLEGWKENKKATEHQKARWPQKRKIAKSNLGKDSATPLLLLEEDGFDGKPLCNLTARTVKAFAWNNENHTFLLDRDLLRIALFFHCSFYEAVVLIIKGQWELFFSRSTNSENLFDSFDPLKRQALLPQFTCGLKNCATPTELFTLFEEHGDWARNVGYNRDQFESLLNQVIITKLFLYSIESAEVATFARQQEEELEILKNSSLEATGDFWLKKAIWQQLVRDAENLHLKVDNQRIENGKIDQKWIGEFGNLFIRLVELENEKNRKLRAIAIKESDPEMTLEEITLLDLQNQEKEKKRLEALQYELTSSQLFPFLPAAPIDGRELQDFQKQCKELLRLIWLKTHPEKTMHFPFTEEQLERFHSYYKQSLTLRDEEKGFDLRSLETLKEILKQVETMWEHIGIDIPENRIVLGDTLLEQITWLEKETIKLDRELEHLQSELYILVNNKDIMEKRASLKSDEDIQSLKYKLSQRIETIELELEEANRRYQGIFRDEL